MKTTFESALHQDRGGKPSVRELLSSLVFDPVDGTIRLNGDRLVMQRAAVNVEMRRELTRILGREETRIFLLRLGFLCGQADARFVRTSWPNLNIGDAFTAGTRLHTFSGVVRVETVHNDFDFRKKRFSGEFLWHDSVEAADFRRLHQHSSEAVCWTQIGFASGYASEFFDTLIVYKELSCAAEGHKSCRVVGKPAEVWGRHDPEVILFRERIAGQGGSITPGIPPVRRPPPRTAEGGLTAVDGITLAPVIDQLDRLAHTSLPALICGPAGSGRFRAARYLHRATGGMAGDIRRLSTTQQTPDAIAELIGGSSRHGRRPTTPETVVLDDIEDMASAAQARLAGLLEDAQIAGGPRIVALSAASPMRLAREPNLRPDLWFALSALPLMMPALADRPDDRLALAEALLPTLAERLGMPPPVLSDAAQDLVAGSLWSGNITEMRAVLTAALAAQSSKGGPLTADDLATQQARIAQRHHSPDATGAGFLQWLDGALGQGGIVMEDIETAIYDAAVSRTSGNLSAAARLLGLTRAQLAYRIEKK